MSTSLNQLILANAPTGAAGAYTQPTTLTVPASGSIVVPVGVWMVPGTASISAQVQTTTAGTYATVLAAAAGGMIFSDGYNTILANSSASAVNVTIYGPGSAVTAPSTFNH